MKLNIGNYSQRIAISMGLDLSDIHILGWIQDFWPEMKRKIIDGEEYGWIQYGYFIKDMPIVKIKTPDGLYRRLKKLEEKGLLKHKGVKDKEGSFSYYKITPKITELLKDRLSAGGADQNPEGGRDEKSDGKDRKPDGTDNKPDRVGMKSRSKDNSTNNHSSISLSSEEDVKKYFSQKGYKSNYKKFFLHYQAKKWKGIKDRVSQADLWEENFKDMNPDLYLAIDTKTEIEDKPVLIEMNNSPFWIDGKKKLISSNKIPGNWKPAIEKFVYFGLNDQSYHQIGVESKFLKDWFKKEYRAVFDDIFGKWVLIVNE